MSLNPLTLPTDKNRNPVLGITVRAGDVKGQLPVTVLDANNAPYDLTDAQITFYEQKNNNKWIVDSNNFVIDDKHPGQFTYSFHDQVSAMGTGTAWFEIKKGDVVDSTQNFQITVEKGLTMSVTNSNYISDFDGLRDKLRDITKDADQTYKQESSDLQQLGTKTINDMQQAYSDLSKQLQTTFKQSQTDRANDWTQDKNRIDGEWSSDKSTYAQQFTDSQNKNATAFTNQQNKINDDWTAQKNKLLADWQTKKDSLDSTITGMQTSLDNLQKALDQLDKTDIPNAAQKVADLKQQIADAEKQFSAVDFSQFVTGTQFKEVQDKFADYYTKAETDNSLAAKADRADVYTKAELDPKLAEAGKVKTVSLNGGNKVAPDSGGNIDLAVPQPDLTEYAKTSDVTAAISPAQTTANEAKTAASTAQSTADANTAKINAINASISQLQVAKHFTDASAAQSYSSAHPTTVCLIDE